MDGRLPVGALPRRGDDAAVAMRSRATGSAIRGLLGLLGLLLSLGPFGNPPPASAQTPPAVAAERAIEASPVPADGTTAGDGATPASESSAKGESSVADGTSPASDSPEHSDNDRPTIVLVVGAGGAPKYEEQFFTWADRWKEAARAAGAQCIEIGREAAEDSPDDAASDRERLQAVLAEQTGESSRPLWLVLIGHGTFYRDVARFNLRGPDVSARELSEWARPLERPLVVINCASCSGPFLKELAAPNRIVMSATRSGAEQNFARFGDYLSAALTDPQADLDHDDQVSLLEAFLAASAGVSRFYEAEARLATEHALLDDNGDGLGTPADFFRGARAVRSARDGAPLDGFVARRQHLFAGPQGALSAEQRRRRDALETQLEQLRARKDELPEDDYYGQLEALLVPLARLYQASADD